MNRPTFRTIRDAAAYVSEMFDDETQNVADAVRQAMREESINRYEDLTDAAIDRAYEIVSGGGAHYWPQLAMQGGDTA